MAFADISYFGDSDTFGGKPAWSGRVTSASQLDQFDWGGGRKSPFASLMGGKTGGDMNRLIEDALKKREKKSKLMESLTGSTLLKDFNKKDNAVGGAAVGITGGGDMRPNDLSFSVENATVNAQFPFLSRIGVDPMTDELCEFTRVQKLTGMGRVASLETEQKIPIVKLKRPGFFFSLEYDKQKKCQVIRNCKVFLGCLNYNIECDDFDVDNEFSGVVYAEVDFSGNEESKMPEISIKTASSVDEVFSPSLTSYKFVYPLYEFEKGSCVRGNPGMMVIPTYTFWNYDRE